MLSTLLKTLYRYIPHSLHQFQEGFTTWFSVQYQLWKLSEYEVMVSSQQNMHPNSSVHQMVHIGRKRLVFIGGGHAHVSVLKTIAENWKHDLIITLISPHTHLVYSGLFPGCISGAVDRQDARVHLPALCAYANVEFINGWATAIHDNDQRVVYTTSNGTSNSISYDILSVNIGSIPTLPGAVADNILDIKNVFSFKPIHGEFFKAWTEMEEKMRNNVATTWRLVMIGGGASGTEMTLSIYHKLQSEANRRGIQMADWIQMTLVTQSESILMGHNTTARRIMQDELQLRQVQIIKKCSIVEMTTNVLLADDGTKIPYDYCFACTQARAPSWLKESGLEVDHQGCLLVEATLKCIPNTKSTVFAVGDCATLRNSPCPKAGVFAVRQSSILAANLRHVLLDEKLESFTRQEQFLSLLGMGDGTCLASKGKLALRAEWVWELKNTIDRRWVSSYSNLEN